MELVPSPGFTKVAGDHVFRKNVKNVSSTAYIISLSTSRKNGVNLCVGCGRCIEGCLTRIDFVDIINEMK